MQTMDRIGLTAALVLLPAAPLHAADSDISTSVSGPVDAYLGQTITVTVSYANAGPDTAGSAYVNAYIPSGVPARIDQMNQQQWDALQSSADGTDSLGNFPRLYEEQHYCEHLLFQVQRAGDDGGPVAGLDPGVTASFSFELEIPMDPPEFGRVTITEPASLAQMWRPAVTGWETLEAAVLNRYSRGGCDIYNGCITANDECFGARVSLIDLIDAELELVNDGTADPTLGCLPLTGFTPGRIALITRGHCMFGDKLFNAYSAGARAALLVNDGRCGDFPDSAQCVLNMEEWSIAAIPIVMVAESDGEPIITALESGQTVRGLIGPQPDPVFINSLVFLHDPEDHDPDPLNDRAGINITVVPQVLQPPVASFTYSPDAPSVGQPILFTDTSTGGPPDQWLWDFGDGSPVSTEQNPAHTFAIGRTYTVSLTVENSMGSDSAELDLVMAESGVRHPSGRRVSPDGP